jgi:predicted RND superfamily exporter protein
MRKIYNYPWLIVAVIALVTVFFSFQLPRVRLDNNNLRFVPKDDPALETSRWIDEMFGSSFFILIGLQRQYGTVFDREFLDRIQVYSAVVENMPYVKEVTSLVNAEYICSKEDSIVVEKLVGDDFSGTAAEIAELKRRLLSWDMYERALFSDDFTATQILIPLSITSDEAGSSEVSEAFMRIRDLARESFADYASVYVTGMPVITATVNEAMNADLKLMMPLVVIVVLAVLFFSFRGLTPVMLPLLTVVIAAVWSVGAMPLFNIKLSVISTVLPVILVAVGSAYGIHIVTHYLHDRGSKPMNRPEHRELVLEVVMKIRKPVFLAALTTFAGFVSFSFTKVSPIREFGYFSSFGVAAAFIVAITLIPSLLIIRGPRVTTRQKRRIEAQESKEGKDTGFSAFLADNLASLALRKKTILFFTLLITIISLYGISKLIIDNILIEYFREDTDIFKSDVFIRKQFGGSKVISVVVEADSPEIVLRPDTLGAMDGLSVYLQRKVPNVGKVMGFTDLIKRINQVFNADESPDGLKPSTAFLGDDFGFDSFGFDDEVANIHEERAEQGRVVDIFPLESNFDAKTHSWNEFFSLMHTAVALINGEDKVAYSRSELIALMDRAGSQFRGMNANDLILELKRQINYEGASYYEIPVDPKRYGKETPAELTRLISNYLVLLSGNTSGYANDPLEPTAIKATVQLRTVGMHDSEEIFREIEKYIAAKFPQDVKVTLGGQTMVERSLNNLVVQSQLVSMLFSLLCVFIIIAVSNKSLIAGCIGITPLSISILINFAVMGFAGIKLNLGTSMVAAVSVGVGIDYTIHCLEAYKREYRASANSVGDGAGDFLRRVFFSSGKAIIINAVSVGAGFAVLLASNFIMLGDLGLLIALTMFTNALISLTVLPALLAVVKPKFIGMGDGGRGIGVRCS